jgi:ankyrin repeat protein
VDLLLLMACQEGDDGKVAELLQSGADPRVTDLQGRSPLELATKEEIKQLLQQALVAA